MFWNIFYNLQSKVSQLLEDALIFNINFLSVISCIIFPLILLILCLLTISFIVLKVVIWFAPFGEPGKLHVAFFHPYCNAGGGGERVLWTAIQALFQRFPNIVCYVYTGDTDATPQQIIENAYSRFNIHFEKKPEFIYLKTLKLVEAKSYPIFTILLQSLGSLMLGAEALSKFHPDIYIDTMGYAFTYPLFHFLGGCTVISYTHYPTISSDMLNRVKEQSEDHNNQALISRSYFLSYIKLGYYYLFAFIYGMVGSSAHVVMVNSSWTKAHISSLWKYGVQPQTVFPPCDTAQFSSLPLISDEKKDFKSIVSIGQFRPEKNYSLQLKSFHKLLQIVEPDIADKLRLVLIGGLRNEEDRKRLLILKSLAANLGIESKITWKINASFPELLQEVQNGIVGIHTMWNEHFGIGIVELMAGGLIMVAHNSGGPKMDIVTPFQGEVTGFLASTEEEYALKIKHILSLSNEEKNVLRRVARASTERFSKAVFRRKFLSCIQQSLDNFIVS